MITCKIYQWIIRKLKPKPKVRVYSNDVRVDYPEGRHIPEWIYEQLWKDIDCSKPVKLDKPMCEDWIDDKFKEIEEQQMNNYKSKKIIGGTNNDNDK